MSSRRPFLFSFFLRSIQFSVSNTRSNSNSIFWSQKENVQILHLEKVPYQRPANRCHSTCLEKKLVLVQPLLRGQTNMERVDKYETNPCEHHTLVSKKKWVVCLICSNPVYKVIWNTKPRPMPYADGISCTVLGWNEKAHMVIVLASENKKESIILYWHLAYNAPCMNIWTCSSNYYLDHDIDTTDINILDMFIPRNNMLPEHQDD